MNYLMLIYLNSRQWSELTPDERNQVHVDCGAWHEELVRSGNSRGAMGLQPASTATTVSEEGGQIVITDGPFAETKEVLGGFEHVECRSLDEALAIAKRFPGLRAGTRVEVRPIVESGVCRE